MSSEFSQEEPTRRHSESPSTLPKLEFTADDHAGDSKNYVRRVLGNSSLMCRCCVCPDDGCRSVVIMAFIIGPTAVFMSSVVPSSEWYTQIIAGLLCILDCFMLLFASACDPGIILPLKKGEPIPVNQQITVNGKEYEQEVCKTCKVLRPARSSHCRVCDVCVEEYDHHCGVVGSCVGLRTFRFFTLFFWITTILATFVFARSVAVAVMMDFSEQTKTDLGRWHAAATIVCCIYSALAGCCVVGNLGFYTQMACRGQTQKDLYGTRKYEEQDCSCFNCCARLFGRMPPSRITAAELI